MHSRWTTTHTCPVPFQLVGPGSWTAIPALLCYDAADPFAVRIVFGDATAPGTAAPDGSTADGSVEPDGDVAWLLSRDLLRSGLEHPVGDGDVRLWPARGAADVLFLHLRAPSGEALFEVPRTTVAEFLRRTETIVPTDSEHALLDLDEQLEALLSNGGADSTGR